jgi:hypothetical protein
MFRNLEVTNVVIMFKCSFCFNDYHAKQIAKKLSDRITCLAEITDTISETWAGKTSAWPEGMDKSCNPQII